MLHLNRFALKACPKCGGDLVLDQGDWLCLHCGTYYYTNLYQEPATLYQEPATPKRDNHPLPHPGDDTAKGWGQLQDPGRWFQRPVEFSRRASYIGGNPGEEALRPLGLVPGAPGVS